MRAMAAVLFLLALMIRPALAAQPFDPFGLARIDPAARARAPMTGVFRDQAGRKVTLAALAGGRPLVLVPVQYLCPNLCGLTLIGVDQAAARQPRQDLTIVVLGIDPREGPSVAATAVASLKDPIVALTGPQSASRAVTDALGFRYAWDARLGQYAHVSAVAVLRPDGRLIRWLPGPQVDPAALAATLDQAGSGGPASSPEGLFLLCYRLITRGGAYDHRVIEAARIAGGATLTLLLVLIGWLAGRGQRRAAP